MSTTQRLSSSSSSTISDDGKDDESHSRLERRHLLDKADSQALCVPLGNRTLHDRFGGYCGSSAVAILAQLQCTEARLKLPKPRAHSKSREER